MASKNFVSKRIAEQFSKNLIYNTNPGDVQAYQRMLMHRCKNLGMKELDIIVGKWGQNNIPNMNMEQMKKFESQILDMETVDIYNLVLQVKLGNEFKDYENLEYVKELRQYALKGLL